MSRIKKIVTGMVIGGAIVLLLSWRTGASPWEVSLGMGVSALALVMPGWGWRGLLFQGRKDSWVPWVYGALWSGALVSFTAYGLRTFFFEEMNKSLIIAAILIPTGLGLFLNFIVSRNHGRQ